MSARIAFVVGTQQAANILNLPPDSPHFLVISGGSATTLAARLEAAIAGGANHVFRFDVSGALAAALKPGDLLCATRVLPDREFWPPYSCDAAWAARIIAATGAEPALFVYSNTTLWTAAEKTLLGEQTNARAVDQETGVVALIADKHNLPWVALGAISDAQAQNLGAGAAAAMNPDGSTNVLGAVESIVTDPAGLPDLLELGSTSGVAFSALARAIADMGVDYCVR